MRDAVRVRMTKDQFQVLKSILSLTYNEPIVARNELLSSFLHQASLDFQEATEQADKVIKAARKLYAGDDVEVDDDAPLSEVDDGVWVGGWLWVHNEEAV